MLTNDRPIIVISDLHLGDRGPRDNFHVGDREEQFTRFLDYVEEQGGQLLINGDFFEFWQINLGAILMARRAQLDRLASLNTVYIPGNHDVLLAPLIDGDWLRHPFFARMTRPFTLSIGDSIFKFCHGHEVDPFNRDPHPSWGHMLTIFAGIFEEKNGSPMLPSGETVEETLDFFGTTLLRLWNFLVKKLKQKVAGDSTSPRDELTPAQNPNRLKLHLEQMKANWAHEGYDVAIVGHTHRPGRFEDWYYNSGSWTDESNNFLRIGQSGTVDVFDWVIDHAEPNTAVITP